MKLYFAPLEGITTYTYRNTHAKMFGGCDSYYSPFINPGDNERLSRKGLRDIAPENNEGINLTVQILTADSNTFLRFAEDMTKMGYDELNINIGCPASTVVKKGRGAGFLKSPYSIEKFLNGIIEKSPLKISVKTRIGYFDTDEAQELFPVYNKFPLERLIVHPRTRNEFYSGTPHREIFSEIYDTSSNPLCYNGDIYTPSDFEILAAQFPRLEGVMIGRGAIRNPALFRQIKGGKKITTDELTAFTNLLAENYLSVLKSDIFTLQKLKEIWVYMIQNYPEDKKLFKPIKKSETLSALLSAITSLPPIGFSDISLRDV